MADPAHFKKLAQCMGQEQGRMAWVDFKFKTRWLDLSTADFAEARLRDYDLSDINFSTAIFLGADLAGADFSDSMLSFADLRRANLRTAVLDRADLSSANLQEANLTDACLEGATLGRTRLSGANLTGADLSGADLSGADLRGASLKFTRLTGARLFGANVAEADLTGAVMDDDAPQHMVNFSQAVVDDRKYREMRSHLRTARELILTRAREEETGGRKQAKGRAASGRHTLPPPKPGEPDLSTHEGCCAILEVPLDASKDDIQRAFRQKAKIFHPDKVRHLNERLQELAAEEFRRLLVAYETLTSGATRSLAGVVWPEGLARRATPYEYTSEEYEALARVNPSSTSILYNLAWKYFEEGRHADALAAFQRVLALDPSDEDAQYNVMVVRLYVELQLPFFGGGA